MAMALRLLSSPPSPPPPPLFFLSSSPFSSALISLPARTLPDNFRCFSKKKETSFANQLLDYIEGGPKLRKWYGAPDRLPKDGGPEAEEDEFQEVDEVRDSVLVTDGESELGQMVILSLILKRARVKTLVKDKRSAIDAFGTYIEPMVGDINDIAFMTKVLRGVRAIVCASNDGFFSDIGRTKGVQHIVLLSQLAYYRESSGLQGIMNSKKRILAEKDEEVVITSGIPYTIIRAGMLQNVPGGKQGFSFDQDSVKKGKLSKEDAAKICVEALDIIPQSGIVLEVVNGVEKVPDWKEKFAALIQNARELQ